MNFHWHCFHELKGKDMIVEDHQEFGANYVWSEKCCKCGKRQKKWRGNDYYEYP